MTLPLAIAMMLMQMHTFDVASIHRLKPVAGEGGRDKIERTPTSLTMRNVTLSTCVKWAYGVQSFQVTGPFWTGAERYDIVARTPAAASQQKLRAMLQSLLAERFKLEIHRDTKEMQVYT